MRAKRKADYHHGRLRQALIETAVKTIAQHGVDALSLRELAARAASVQALPIITSPTAATCWRRSPRKALRGSRLQLIAARDAAPDNASARLEALG